MSRLSESHFYERCSAHDDPLAKFDSKGLVILGDCIIVLWYPTRELIWREFQKALNCRFQILVGVASKFLDTNNMHIAVEDHLGSGWRGGLSVDTDTDSFSNLAQESVLDQRPSRGSSGWNSPVEDDMEASENASDHTATGDSARPELLSPKEPKGRFYEQYREKRDAKLREESESKKAERDAKLKSMEEVLERRKAEMAARKGSSAKQNLDAESHVRDEKVRTSKVDVVKIKKHKVLFCHYCL